MAIKWRLSWVAQDGESRTRLIEWVPDHPVYSLDITFGPDGGGPQTQYGSTMRAPVLSVRTNGFTPHGYARHGE